MVNSFPNWRVYSGFNDKIKSSRCAMLLLWYNLSQIIAQNFNSRNVHYEALSRYALYHIRGNNECNLFRNTTNSVFQLQCHHHPSSISTTVSSKQYFNYNIIQTVSQLQYHHPSSTLTAVSSCKKYLNYSIIQEVFQLQHHHHPSSISTTTSSSSKQHHNCSDVITQAVSQLQ